MTFDVRVQDLSERYVLSYYVARAVTLEPWGWTQLDSPALLEANGSRAGHVFVTADGPIYVYAVVNDRATNDGSFVVADSPVRGGSDGFTVAVETPGFVTEAALFSSGSPSSISFVDLRYTDALGPVPGAGANADIGSPFYGVKFVPNVIDLLRASPRSSARPRRGRTEGSSRSRAPWGRFPRPDRRALAGRRSRGRGRAGTFADDPPQPRRVEAG